MYRATIADLIGSEGYIHPADTGGEPKPRPDDVICNDCGASIRPHAATRLSPGGRWRCRPCFDAYLARYDDTKRQEAADAYRRWYNSLSPEQKRARQIQEASRKRIRGRCSNDN